VCMYVYVYVCMYVCMYDVRMYVCMYVCMYICKFPAGVMMEFFLLATSSRPSLGHTQPPIQ